MPDAVYVRLGENALDFVEQMAEDENITRSEAINKLLHYAAGQLRVEKAIAKYKEGKCTIREAAGLAGLRYFEFFDHLAKYNLIGTSSENVELLLDMQEKARTSPHTRQAGA
ncbi:hypothetical protein HY642_00205 [Candidatus Woesearchaeota archaeon]|nr:hypothetical protein [Candidatus Woesearchaeota archaeon]